MDDFLLLEMNNELLSTERHESDELKKIAIAKLRKNKDILRDPDFKNKFPLETYTNLVLEEFVL